MTSMKAKVKQYWNDHSDQFWLAGIAAFYAGAMAACGVIIYKGLKDQAEKEAWIAEQNFAGKAVYQLADGKLIAVTNEAVKFN
jgi:hypothetical protein